MEEGTELLGRTREAAIEAIRICRDRGVLKEYLKEREKEVINIMIMLFNQEYATQQYGKAQKEEGREEGETKKCIENIRSLMKTLKFSTQQAMDALQIPPQEQEKYAKLL